MYEKSLVHLRIKPGQTCQHMHTWNHTQPLKLVRTPLKVYFTVFKSIFLSLYAPITSDEYHAWFHLNAASQAVMNVEQVNITKNSYLW